jgi:hypothetical protein
VLPAINFNNEHRFKAGKVREVRTDRDLAAKTEPPDLSRAQVTPQEALSICGRVAELAGTSEILSFSHFAKHGDVAIVWPPP